MVGEKKMEGEIRKVIEETEAEMLEEDNGTRSMPQSDVRGIVMSVCSVCFAACVICGGIAFLCNASSTRANTMALQMIDQRHAAVKVKDAALQANKDLVAENQKLVEQIKEIATKYSKSVKLNKQVIGRYKNILTSLIPYAKKNKKIRALLAEHGVKK